MLIRYVASHARAHLKSVVLIFILFVLFTHHTTSIDTVTTHQSRDMPLTTDMPTKSTSATQNESMINNQSNRHMYDNNNDSGNDYPMDSVTSNHLPLDNGDIKGDTDRADGKNTETILLKDTQSSIDGEEERIDILESQQNHDTTGEDIGDNTGNHDDEIGNYGDNFGNHGDNFGNHGNDVGDHGDIGNDNKDNDGLISDNDRFSDQDNDQDDGNHGDDTSNSIDNGHAMEDHRHTVEDNGDTMVDNGGVMEDYDDTVEEDGDKIVDDDGTEGNNGDTVGVTDQDIEHVQEASDINKSLSNDSDTHQIPNDDQIRLMNTTDQLSLSEIEAIAMNTSNEGAGLELKEEIQENNDDDIVTFEEFKNKMNQEGVSAKPSQIFLLISLTTVITCSTCRCRQDVVSPHYYN